jgi:uncharacterized protein (TIGR02001 family)
LHNALAPIFNFIQQEHIMKKNRLFASLLGAPLLVVSMQTAQAADATKENEAGATVASASGTDLGNGFTLTGNATVINDYRFRGYSQTNFRPAGQLGIDLSHSSGFYLGNWNSNVDWVNGASLEMDFYGGWKGAVGHGITLDAGVIQYTYPGAAVAVSPSTTELYLGMGYENYTLKAYYAPTNYFGGADSKGNWYFDGNANYDLGSGWGIGLHAGYQTLNNATNAVTGSPLSGYFDYKAGVTKDISGWVFGVSVVGASSDAFALTSQGYNAGRVGMLVSVAKGF